MAYASPGRALVSVGDTTCAQPMCGASTHTTPATCDAESMNCARGLEIRSVRNAALEGDALGVAFGPAGPGVATK